MKIVILAIEILILFFAQWRLSSQILATIPRFLSYVLLAPGVILHESAHLLACYLLGVPAGGQCVDANGKRMRVSFFYPKENGEGLTLGSVPHASTDPLRSTIISIAPLLLVPPLLLGILTLLFSTAVFSSPIDTLSSGPIWKVALAAYLVISAGPAAFPSPGDEISPVALGLLIALVGFLLLQATENTLLFLNYLLLAPVLSTIVLTLLLHYYLHKRGLRMKLF